MRRLLGIVLICVLLVGCGANDSELDRGMDLRGRLLKSAGCEFDVRISADYGQQISRFSMHCNADASGNLSFTVSAPETIQGITGVISGTGGKLTYDDVVLAFELLADGQVSPVSGPWLFVKALRSGYINACGPEKDRYLLVIHDSYQEDALVLHIWLDQENIPVQAEVYWQDRSVLSLEISSFCFA